MPSVVFVAPKVTVKPVGPFRLERFCATRDCAPVEPLLIVSTDMLNRMCHRALVLLCYHDLEQFLSAFRSTVEIGLSTVVQHARRNESVVTNRNQLFPTFSFEPVGQKCTSG